MAKKTVMDAGKYVPTEAMFKAVDTNFEEVAYNKRQRFTIAEVNAGATLLSARVGKGYRLIGCEAIAIGGSAATGTTVDILGTQSASSVKLVAYAQASLTRSAVLKAGGTGAAVLADGASFVKCDNNKAITILKTGTDFATATHVDVNITFAVE